MQAAEFDEGVAVIDIQLARILIERGQFAQAEASMSHTAAEFTRLQKHAFALEASVVLAEARLSQSNPAAALDLLDRAAQAAGQDAKLIRPRTARVRARALAALGRLEDAENEIDNGIVAAREHALRYDEALLLALRAEIVPDGRAQADGALADADARKPRRASHAEARGKSDGCSRELNRASVATRGVVTLNVGVLDELELPAEAAGLPAVSTRAESDTLPAGPRRCCLDRLSGMSTENPDRSRPKRRSRIRGTIPGQKSSSKLVVPLTKNCSVFSIVSMPPGGMSSRRPLEVEHIRSAGRSAARADRRRSRPCTPDPRHTSRSTCREPEHTYCRRGCCVCPRDFGRGRSVTDRLGLLVRRCASEFAGGFHRKEL